MTVDSAGRLISRLVLGLAAACLAATVLLISPPLGETYPGQIPWRESSWLKAIVELMSLRGSVHTIRGVEIKDFAFFLSVGAGLALLAILCVIRGLFSTAAQPVWPRWSWLASQPHIWAQVGFVSWVLVSFASIFWSSDPAATFGQAALYAFGVAWAVSLAATLHQREALKILAVYVGLSAVTAILCTWYFLERNPHHRPGFPLGNPTVVAAAVVPAILLCGCAVAAAFGHWRKQRRGERALLIAALAMLPPLLGCLYLTRGRGAMLALAVGTGLVIYLQAGQRIRRSLVLCGAVTALALGVYFLFVSSYDLTMARGGSIRLRLYAWRYAAELWQQRPIYGMSAGSFPRLSSQFAAADRTLDPAAFMAEIVEHAHNELFEVLAEIGLIGGITFVLGHVATFLAALLRLRATPTRQQRWLLTGLLAGIVAIWADAFFGVGLRLPGLPAIYFTLLGTLWALCRTAWPSSPVDGATPAAATADKPTPASVAADKPTQQLFQDAVARVTARPARVISPWLLLIGVTALAGSCAGFWLAARTWSGVQYEHTGRWHLSAARYEESADAFAAALPKLLDPVRRLDNQRLRIHALLGAATALVPEYLEAVRTVQAESSAAGAASESSDWSDSTRSESPPPAETAHTTSANRVAASESVTLTAEGRLLHERITSHALRAFSEATEFSRIAPQLASTETQIARAAEILAVVTRAVQPATAADWRRVAWAAWLRQRRTMPYDVEALLALRRYPGELSFHVALLRDALRMGDAKGAWLASLRELLPNPRFEETLERFRSFVATVSPETNLDSLVISMAPETFRLSAATRRLRGDFPGAAADAAAAAALSRPLRTRFPLLMSVALAEQAEYRLLAEPTNGAATIPLLREAIAALPVIQAQKYEEQLRPFRALLVMCLLAAGREPEAERALEGRFLSPEEIRAELAAAYTGLADSFRREPQAAAAPLRAWLERAIRLNPAAVGPWSQLAWLEARDLGAAGALRVLHDATAAGVRPDQAAWIRRSLALEFPELADELNRP